MLPDESVVADTVAKGTGKSPYSPFRLNVQLLPKMPLVHLYSSHLDPRLDVLNIH